MSTTDHELLAIGRLVKAFGVRGDLIAQVLTENPSRLRKLRTVLVGHDASEVTEQQVEHVAVDPRGARLKLAGVDDRTSAEKYIGRFLFIPPEQRAAPKRGRYFVHDVIGLDVVDDVRGPVGVVHDVLKYPAHDVYVVRRENHEFMIPAVKEFVLKINLAARTMTVHLIPGMDDEDADLA